MGDLRNKVVIGDALHTQRQVSIQIGTAGGHYLWTVKANYPLIISARRFFAAHPDQALSLLF